VTEEELSGKDNSVKYHESYQKFLSAYEGELERFLKDEGVTAEEFTALCEKVSTIQWLVCGGRERRRGGGTGGQQG
jgi:hypothetical protein